MTASAAQEGPQEARTGPQRLGARKRCAQCGSEALSLNWCALTLPGGMVLAWFCCLAHRQEWKESREAQEGPQEPLATEGPARALGPTPRG